MRKTIASAVVMLAQIAATALAADTSYPHASNQPLITGTVVSVNDYQIVVDTDQGQALTLDIDSRTLVPAELSPGTSIQVEFKLMENGRHYASRIVPARGGMDSSPRAAYGSRHGGHAATSSSRSTSGAPGSEGAVASRMPEALPQTASSQPLIALLGMLALLGVGLVVWTLRPRRV